jgi:hypothetical protein
MFLHVFLGLVSKLTLRLCIFSVFALACIPVKKN